MSLKKLLILAAMALTGITPTPSMAQKPQSGEQNTGAPSQPRISWITMKQAQEAPASSIVYTRGTIVSISEPRPNSRQPFTIYLTDETGSCRAVIFQDVYAQMEDTSFLAKGTSVEIFGELQDYRGIRQMQVRAHNHIRKTPGSQDYYLGFGRQAPENAFFPLTIGAINMTTIGQPVRVKGVVSEVEEPANERTPWRVIVEDSTGKIQVIYWEDVHKNLPNSERPIVGESFEFAGVVNEYRGLLQLRIDDAANTRRQFMETAVNSQKRSHTMVDSN